MLLKDLCEDPAVQMDYSREGAVGLQEDAANKSCHVILIVSQNRAAVYLMQVHGRAIFSELLSNYVFIIMWCFHNLS